MRTRRSVKMTIPYFSFIYIFHVFYDFDDALRRISSIASINKLVGATCRLPCALICVRVYSADPSLKMNKLPMLSSVKRMTIKMQITYVCQYNNETAISYKQHLGQDL